MASLTADRECKGKVLLYVGTFGFSHTQFALTIGEWLIADGFEVHLLVSKSKPMDDTNFPKIFTKKHIVESEVNQKLVQKMVSKMTAGANRFYTSGLFNEMIATIKDTMRTFAHLPILEDIEKEKYDILVGEIFSPIQILKLRDIGIPKFIYITALPFDQMSADVAGLPSPSSYIPIMNECCLNGDDMGFWDRARNLYTALYIRFVLRPKVDEDNKAVIRDAGYDDVNAALIRAKQSYDLRVFNSNILLDYPRPTLHNVVHVGGSMTKEPKALEEPVAIIFAKPSSGVILISFGTLAESSNFPKTFLPSIRAVMEALPSYEFIFRVGNVDEHTEIAKLANVTVLDWVDQVSILAHPSTKLFYTHCGLNSLNESLFFGVPMVASPVFGDQFYNATLLRKKKVGILVELKTITPAKLITAFKMVLEDPMYATEARHIAQKTRDLPIQPKETFLRWVNYIHKHGAKQDFTLKAVELSFVQLHNLDIIFVALVALLIGVVVLTKLHSALFG